MTDREKRQDPVSIRGHRNCHDRRRGERILCLLGLGLLLVTLLAPASGLPAAAAGTRSVRTGQKNGTVQKRTSQSTSGTAGGNMTVGAGTLDGAKTGSRESPDTAQTIPGLRKVIFIGDSRTVGVYNAVSGSIEQDTLLAADSVGDLWSAKVSEGLWWMRRSGVPSVEDAIDADTDVVICCGINDAGRSDFVRSYAAYLNQKAAEWGQKGAPTYFVSVLPVRKSVGQVTNKRIRSANKDLMSQFSSDIGYIDLDTPFRNKLSYLDDLHYQPRTCQLLYQYLKLTLAADHETSGV